LRRCKFNCHLIVCAHEADREENPRDSEAGFNAGFRVFGDFTDASDAFAVVH